MSTATITRSTCDRCGETHDGVATPKSWGVVDFYQRSSDDLGDGAQNDADVCASCYSDLLRWWNAPKHLAGKA